MEVADKGSIRAAAESLAITQPALSRSIRAMEEELGVKLVERGPRGAELTPVGTRLLKYSRIIDANLALAEKELRGFRDSHSRIEQITFGMSWLTEALIAGPLIERVLRNAARNPLGHERRRLRVARAEADVGPARFLHRPAADGRAGRGDHHAAAARVSRGRRRARRAPAHEARRGHDRRPRRRAVDTARRRNGAADHLRQLLLAPRRRRARRRCSRCSRCRP